MCSLSGPLEKERSSGRVLWLSLKLSSGGGLRAALDPASRGPLSGWSAAAHIDGKKKLGSVDDACRDHGDDAKHLAQQAGSYDDSYTVGSMQPAVPAMYCLQKTDWGPSQTK